MARNRTLGQGQAVVRDLVEGPETAKAEMAGGTPGILVEQQASKTIHTPGGFGGVGFRADPDAPKIEVQKFRVRNGGHVMLGGVRVAMRVGKEVDELSYDLDLLRRQGIVLDPIKLPAQDSRGEANE